MRTMHRIAPSIRTPRRRAAARGLLACTLAAAAACEGGLTEQPAPVELGEIAFCRGGIISCWLTVIEPDGSGAHPLLPHAAADPSWSPDGTRIAFITSQDQNPELYVWNSGGSTRRLTRTPSRTELSPAWSPDGTQIVFGGWQSYRIELFVIGADGTGERQLTSGQGEAWRPDWSPDGRSIAYQVYHQVAVMSVDGGGEPAILADGEAPAWSPDGTRIAFVRRGRSESGAEERAIFTMAPDGSAQTRVTSGPDDGEPDWSPDGRRIVFTRRVDRVELHVVNADGGGLAILARDSARNVSPSWRP